MQLGRASSTALCLSLLLVGVSVSPVRAQAILEGKLTGTVTSEDGVPLPGATVEISSPALLGTRTTTTSTRGTYVLLNLPPGKYRLTASRDAFKTVVQENVDVSAASVLTVNMTLPVGTVQEQVMVTAESPIVDTKTSTIDSKIDQEMLQRLPTSRDAFLDLALTTPGMAPGSGAPSQTTEFQSPTAYSSATNENVFLINGVDATNPRAGAFGSLVNVNYDAVEEVRIVALGSRAEYGSFSGAAIDVVTKSGSNDLHGSAAFYSKLGSVASNQPAPGEDLGAPFLHVNEGDVLAGEIKTDWEGSGTVGGPIVKDKLWFFGAFNYLRGTSVPPLSSLNSESWGRYADIKLNAAPFTNHRAFVAYHYECNDGNGWSWGNQPGWDTSMTYGSKTKNNTVSAQWQWFSQPQDDALRQVAGLLDRRHALHSRGRSQPSGLHQLVEVDRRLRQLRHQRRLPVRRGLSVEPQHAAGRLLALRRGVPGRARPQVRRPVHEGTQQLPGRVLPELRQLPLPVPLDPERPVHAVLVRRHRAHVLQPEGHDQPFSDRAHR